MPQSPVVSIRRDHQPQMATPALAAQAVKRASEKPKVALQAHFYEAGPLAGRRNADCQSGYPAQVYLGLSGRRSTLNVPLFQMIANHSQINTIYHFCRLHWIRNKAIQC